MFICTAYAYVTESPSRWMSGTRFFRLGDHVLEFKPPAMELTLQITGVKKAEHGVSGIFYHPSALALLTKQSTKQPQGQVIHKTNLIRTDRKGKFIKRELLGFCGHFPMRDGHIHICLRGLLIQVYQASTMRLHI